MLERLLDPRLGFGETATVLNEGGERHGVEAYPTTVVTS